MSDIASIIKKNNDTFYNYRTGKPVGIKARLVAFALISALFGLSVTGNLNDFLDGIITINSILIGFSFTVMFFLVSREPAKEIDTPIIEDKILSKRLNKLAKELFHNVAYFNMVAIACTIIAVSLMIPGESALIWSLLNHFPAAIVSTISEAYRPLSESVTVVAKIVFFFSLTEAIYTFWRTTSRIVYLFEERISSVCT